MDTSSPTPRLRIGVRAVVRHRIPGGLTDSVGVVEALDESSVSVRTRRGLEVLAWSEVTTTKVVPPRPARRGAPHRALSMDDLQRVMAAGWPAVTTAPLGAWLLRASAGYTRRANSVLPVGDPGMELGAAVDLAERWYADHHLPCQFSLHGPLGFAEQADPLGAELLARGYAARSPTLVLTAATALTHTLSEASAAGPVGLTVRAEGAPSPAWWSLGDPRAAESPEHRAAAEQITTGAPEQVFLTASEGRAVVAVARVAFAHAWAGLTGLTVHPEHRRRGIASRLVAETARAARDRGIRSVYLQVVPDNDAARALYAPLGFEPHHEYRYLC